MDEQLMFGELNGLLDVLDARKEEMEAAGPPISLTLPDGETNYMAMIRLLRDDQYADWREANPDIARSLSRNVSVQATTGLLQTTNDLSKLAFGLSQIKRARSVNDRMPGKIATPSRDQLLTQQISELQQDIEQGLSRTERSLAEAEDDRAYGSELSAAEEFSGGQAAAAAAASRVASARRATRTNQRIAASHQIRQQQRQEMSRLLALRQQEIDRGLRTTMFNNQVDQSNFRVINQAKQDLMRAGYTNAFNATDALFRDLDEMSYALRENAPGFVSVGNLREDDGPLNAVFNNPLRTMATGSNLFGPTVGEIVEQGYNTAMDNITDQAIQPFNPQMPM